jgi:dTDP-4-amino-4,6-dideoxygalactose transaminase
MFNRNIPVVKPVSDYKSEKYKIRNAIFKVLNSGEYILGSNVELFEQEFAKYIGAKFCIGLNSGTDALILALKALEISVGDEVIVPSHTAVATVSAICALGAIPVFVDVDSKTYNLQASHLSDLISKNTKAIIAVHLYGQACDIDSLIKVCSEFQINLIEDCSQSHGSKWKEIKTGNFGIVSCFSFYPTKNLGALGDAGAVITNNKALANKIYLLRQYGWDENRIPLIKASVSRLDEIQAAILRVKLKTLDEKNLKRRSHANRYLTEIKNPLITLPYCDIKCYHTYHLFVIRVPYRSYFQSKLLKSGIETGIHYKTPVHRTPAYELYNVNSKYNLSNTEQISTEILSLPMYPELKKNEITKIIDVLNSIELENK